MKKTSTKLRCPYCNYEYLLGEIFLPNYLVGQPERIERDYLGNILYNEGLEQDVTEKYTCDKCKNTFGIKAHISTTTHKIS